MDKVGILRDWNRRIWAEGDLSAIESFFAPLAGADGILPDGQLGANDLRALVPALRAMVRDLRVDIDRNLEGDDWLWAQVTANATRANGTSPVRASGQIMMRFSQGKIVESYHSFDFLTFFTQAGLLPDDAFLLLLSGERLG